MTVSRDMIGDPELAIIEGSEINAFIDTAAVGTDHVCRPVLINQEDTFLQLTVEDAQRLRDFLDIAIPDLIRQMNSRRQ